MNISPYKSSDKEEIKHLFTRVFSDSENTSEGKLIVNLAFDLLNNTDPQDLFAFTACENEKIMGCIIFSKLMFDTPINAFILSPIAIDTEHQGRGIGQALINYGINQLKQADIELVFTYGDLNFYSKVGFEQITQEVAQAPFHLSQPEGWLCQSLIGNKIPHLKGTSRCVQALNHVELW